MEGKGDFRLLYLGNGAKKKRSNASRRPHHESQPAYNCIEMSSSTPPSDNFSEVSVDKDVDYGIYTHKELNRKQFSTRASCNNVSVAAFGGNEQMHNSVDSSRFGECALPQVDCEVACQVAQHSQVSENRVKKVKLKVGGVTRTIHANSDGASAAAPSSAKYTPITDAVGNTMIQDSPFDIHSLASHKVSGLRGVPWRSFSSSGFKMAIADSSSGSESVRKSKRIPKRRILDVDIGGGEYGKHTVGKNKTPGLDTEYDEESEDCKGGRKRRQKLSEVLKRQFDSQLYSNPRTNVLSGKAVKKSKSVRAFEDDDYLEEVELSSDVEPKSKRKKGKIECPDLLGEREMTVITRRRAIRSSEDMMSGLSVDLVKFPNGLPPAPPKKQKILSTVDQQLKKAEAAERRRMQAEKAARESQAEAIRKILGQDSSRKKREEKIRKRQEEVAEEKAAKATVIRSETVRWVMGPARTVVTFPEDMGLPSIFGSRSCSYPPPREKCAAPSCTNPYRYRDSKSKLPLCSLNCYKAMQEGMHPVIAC